MELWKVCALCDKYEVSSLGQVRNIKTKKILKQHTNNRGYAAVSIDGTGIARNQRVHKLVVLTWYGEIPEGYEIDHINRIRTDNRLENLRVVSHTENMQNQDHWAKAQKIKETWKQKKQGN